MTTRWILGALLVAIAVAGCASREILPVRGRLAPDGVDLSGRWILQSDSQESHQRLRDAEIAAAGGRDRIFTQSRERSRNDGSLVHVFLESGRNLKISQTDDGLFISFDRSVVEEYRFGEYHPVSVGPVSADRSSGWEGDAYVIETLDQEGNKLLDRYRLEDDGGVLVRQITIYKRKAVDLSVVQKFDRT